MGTATVRGVERETSEGVSQPLGEGEAAAGGEAGPGRGVTLTGAFDAGAGGASGRMAQPL